MRQELVICNRAFDLLAVIGRLKEYDKLHILRRLIEAQVKYRTLNQPVGKDHIRRDNAQCAAVSQREQHRGTLHILIFLGNIIRKIREIERLVILVFKFRIIRDDNFDFVKFELKRI